MSKKRRTTSQSPPRSSAAVRAAKSAGALMRRQLHANKRANAVTQHDIKLELDVRCQKLIEKALQRSFPAGRPARRGRHRRAMPTPNTAGWWTPLTARLISPTAYPHACVSIALQRRAPAPEIAEFQDGYQTLVGVVYEPFCDELWTAIRGQSGEAERQDAFGSADGVK